MSKDITIIDEWNSITAPPPPALLPVTVRAAGPPPSHSGHTAAELQLADSSAMRCIYPENKGVPEKGARKMAVIHSLIPNTKVTDIWEQVAPIHGEPVVESGVDKFFENNWKISWQKGILGL